MSSVWDLSELYNVWSLYGVKFTQTIALESGNTTENKVMTIQTLFSRESF